MSASDKKKQRKAEQAVGQTQRQQREQAEAQAAKKKRMIYTAVGVVCALAAAALLIWDGTSGVRTRSQYNEVAVTVDGKDYTVADMRYYYNQARNTYYSEYYSQLAAYGLATFDPSISDGAQWYNEAEGMTYADYFRDSAIESVKQTAAVCKAASAAGFSITADGQKIIDDQLAQIDTTRIAYNLTRSAFFEQQYGISEKDFVRNLTNDVLASEFSTYHQENVSYDDAALREYYEGHKDALDSYTYRSFFISGAAANPTDADGNPIYNEDGTAVTASEEEIAASMAQAKAKADQAAAEIRAEKDLDAAFAEVAPNYVSESTKASYVNNPDYSLVSGARGETLTGNGSAVASYLMDPDLAPGSVGVVESPNNGYYVVLFKERKLDDEDTVDVRHILIRPEMADGATEPTEEAMEAAKAEAQSLMDEWSAGEKTAESFGELANEHSSDQGSNTKGGLYDHVYKGEMVANFDSWIFDPARQSGDVGLVENRGNYFGWHVVYFQGTNEPYWKHQAITAKQESDQTEWLTGLTENIQVTQAEGMSKVGAANTATATQAAQ